MTEGVLRSSVPPGGNIDSTAPPPARRHVKRRNFFVKKWLQSRYIIYYLAIMALSGFGLFALMERYAHRALYLEMRKGHSAVFDTWGMLEPRMLRANLVVVLAVVAVAAVTTLALTWTVHRASGVLSSNVRDYMKGSPAGQWAPIRHPVEFQHLQGRLAGALSGYQDRVAGIRRETADFAKSARAARQSAEAATVSRREIAELRAGLERVKRHFDNRGEGVSHES